MKKFIASAALLLVFLVPASVFATNAKKAPQRTKTPSSSVWTRIAKAFAAVVPLVTTDDDTGGHTFPPPHP